MKRRAKRMKCEAYSGKGPLMLLQSALPRAGVRQASAIRTRPEAGKEGEAMKPTKREHAVRDHHRTVDAGIRPRLPPRTEKDQAMSKRPPSKVYITPTRVKGWTSPLAFDAWAVAREDIDVTFERVITKERWEIPVLVADARIWRLVRRKGGKR